MLSKQSGRSTRKNGFRWFKIQTSFSFTRTNFSSSSSSRPNWYLLCLQGQFSVTDLFNRPQLGIFYPSQVSWFEIQGNDITWYAPSSLKELAKLKSDFPDAKLITGNTECRLEQKFRKIEYAKQIYTRGIKEICQINVTNDFIEIGSGNEFSRFHHLFINCPSVHGQSVRLALINDLWENSEKPLRSMKLKNLWRNDSKM